LSLVAYSEKVPCYRHTVALEWPGEVRETPEDLFIMEFRLRLPTAREFKSHRSEFLEEVKAELDSEHDKFNNPALKDLVQRLKDYIPAEPSSLKGLSWWVESAMPLENIILRTYCSLDVDNSPFLKEEVSTESASCNNHSVHE
jgi:hypothetical protein